MALPVILMIQRYDHGYEHGVDSPSLRAAASSSVSLPYPILICIASILVPAQIPVSVKFKVGAVVSFAIGLAGLLTGVYIVFLLPLFFTLDTRFQPAVSMLFKLILRTGVHTTLKKAILEVSTPTTRVYRRLCILVIAHRHALPVTYYCTSCQFAVHLLTTNENTPCTDD
jgi:hypothetical protein